VRDSYSCRHIAKELKISVSTAFKWRYKVLASLGTWQLCFQVLLKGRRNAFCSVCIKAAISRTKQYPATRRGEFFKPFGRYPRNQCKEVDQRGRNKQQVPVLVLRQTARTVSLVMPSRKTEGISSQILPVLSQDTVLCTDSYREYKTVSTLILKRFGTSALYPQKHARTFLPGQDVGVSTLYPTIQVNENPIGFAILGLSVARDKYVCRS
jgi:ISXO2-like transposase domain